MSHVKIGLVLMCVVGLFGCASTQQTRSVEQSGFLGDYSMLKEGEKDETLLIYKNPDADWKKYTKVILDPVTIWIGQDSQLNDVEPEDRQRLADLFYVKLHEELKKDYEMVKSPGPDVMHMQAAITESEGSNPVLDTVSSIVPQLRVLTGVKGLATGVSGFTGSASVEMKVTDSMDKSLLAAAVDRRGGTKNLRGLTNSWNDVEESFRYWAEKVRWRACLLKGGTECVEPEA
ncbi:MAG TPA: DUF3313 domain-containing protein [Nitrospirales bacterium]|nr:DUF3313 domain-containing protein [Nitrospiraceae bacterium]HNP29056.1 DUF3313 domain-containing protein [Nitrospirales bacterium]